MSLITGTQHIGQGHETTFPQILAARLGLPNARIRLDPGRHRPHPSRRRAWQLARHLYGRHGDLAGLRGDRRQGNGACRRGPGDGSEADIRFEAGRFVVSGTDRAIGLLEVAALGREGKPLDTFHAWTREHMTFPNGAHVVEVEVDRDTGRVALVRYTAVDDYGVLVNPMVASGQAHGAMAQVSGRPCWRAPSTIRPRAR